MDLVIERRHDTVDLVRLVSDVAKVSKSQARRLIGDGAVKIESAGGLVPYRWLTCCVGDVDGKVVRIGKRVFVRPVCLTAAKMITPTAGL